MTIGAYDPVGLVTDRQDRNSDLRARLQASGMSNAQLARIFGRPEKPFKAPPPPPPGARGSGRLIRRLAPAPTATDNARPSPEAAPLLPPTVVSPPPLPRPPADGRRVTQIPVRAWRVLLAAVCDHFPVTVHELLGPGTERPRHVSEARGALMALARDTLNAGDPAIGRRLRLDHSSVYRGLERHRGRMAVGGAGDPADAALANVNEQRDVEGCAAYAAAFNAARADLEDLMAPPPAPANEDEP
jgi:hypothetical protein